MAKGPSKAIPRRSDGCSDSWMSDRQLLKSFVDCRDGSAEKAFATLVGRHGPMILRVCKQVLGNSTYAEDAFQATFLVLARRSRSIRRPELLGNWLYGVALRTAREVKMREARRRRYETPIVRGVSIKPSGRTVHPETELIRREEFDVLHEEVSHLPERYRVPVILCELEGLTYQEAAQKIQCPVGTIGVRLSRARECLRVRLLRRGIVPAVALKELLFEADSTAALISPVLLDSTVKAAIGFAAGDAAASGLVSATVVVVTEAVLKVMALIRLKVGTGLALVGCLTATAGWFGVHEKMWNPPIVAEILAATAHRELSPPRDPGLSIPVTFAVSEEPFLPAPLQGTSVAEFPIPVLAAAKLVRPVRAEETRGEMLFVKEWAVNDPLTPRGDGLGPLYNETSCVACHGQGGPGGAGPDSKNVVILTATSAATRNRVKQLEKLHPGFHSSRSIVLHRFGTDPNYEAWRRRLYDSSHQSFASKNDEPESIEERMERIRQRTAPRSRFSQQSTLLTPSPGLDLRVSERNSPALFGVGQIDAIPSTVMIEEATRQPEAVRGRVNRNAQGRVGRFGWKSQIATLHEFVRGACASELGLEVAGHSQPVSPLDLETKAKGLDLAEPDCDALVAYVRALPAPVVVDPTGPSGSNDMTAGRQIFAEVGCASCHSPSLGEVRGIYSDLLLHNMGQNLADDGRSYGFEGPEFPGGPSPGEWRTPPLWGFRDSSPYLHDGRAETLEEAVALHGGQGAESARKFFSLGTDDQAKVEAFLKSLVAPSAAAMPGMILASELETRLKADRVRQAEARIRKQRERVALQEEQSQKESRQRKQAAEAARRAQIQFPIATSLEKLGKFDGALAFYREIVRVASDTEEGRAAVDRIASLRLVSQSP